MPLNKQAHVQHSHLYNDVKTIANTLLKLRGEVSWDEFLEELSRGLWDRGWCLVSRVESITDDGSAGSYLTTGEPACQCKNPREPAGDGIVYHEAECPQYREVADGCE